MPTEKIAKTPMYILLSPAKSLDFARSSEPLLKGHKPAFLDATKSLHDILKKLSVDEIARLMHISTKLAQLNHDRFQSWSDDYVGQDISPEGEKKFDYALRPFAGDVYKGIDVDSYSASDWTYADKHIGILSGFYGVLSPLTYLKPYRLEMGTRLRCTRGGVQCKNLYEFWGDTIARHINTVIEDWKNPIVLNLASVEYAKAARLETISAKVVNVDFKVDRGDGDVKIIAIYAKQARGILANLIVQKRIESREDVQKQEPLGFIYDAKRSSEEQLVYIKTIKKP